MTAETPQDLPATPVPESEIIPSEVHVPSAAELEAAADRYHRISNVSVYIGGPLVAAAAAGEFVSEVTGNAVMNTPLAEWGYIGGFVAGGIALAASVGAKLSAHGYWGDSLTKTQLDDRR